ncbi:MAG TPA: heparinase II/III family protein, partial [Usitatibacter sp.]|nr:heparinase II/III family protein [Usitatibacter sp.]
WVAFHSRLDEPARASVYFKSSPYGSYNHSHGDQNSFVVNYKGKRLAIASGYYDDYRTAHWTNWYKQTLSANAITFDGGQGQGFNDKSFSGEISRFVANGNYDTAAGRAQKAYGGALSKAQRTMVYMRDTNVVVVYDILASDTARTWEWNIHALNQMSKLTDNKIVLANGDAKMCVEVLASPGVTFAQTDQFSSAPSGSNMPNQWHGRFATAAKSTNAEFVTIMRVGSDCTPQPIAAAAGGKRLVVTAAAKTTTSAAATRISGGWSVAIDGKTVTLLDDTATVK